MVPSCLFFFPSREALRSSGGHTRVRPADERAASRGGNGKVARVALGPEGGPPEAPGAAPGGALGLQAWLLHTVTAEETAQTSGPRSVVQPTLPQPEVWALTEVVAGRI